MAVWAMRGAWLTTGRDKERRATWRLDPALSCGRRMTSTGTPPGGASVVRLLVLAHPAGIVRRDFHADRLGAAARGDQHGRILGQALQALQGERAAGFGGDHQAAGAALVAQDDDAAAAQLGQGAFNGGECSGGARMYLTRGHTLPLAPLAWRGFL